MEMNAHVTTVCTYMGEFRFHSDSPRRSRDALRNSFAIANPIGENCATSATNLQPQGLRVSKSCKSLGLVV